MTTTTATTTTVLPPPSLPILEYEEVWKFLPHRDPPNNNATTTTHRPTVTDSEPANVDRRSYSSIDMDKRHAKDSILFYHPPATTSTTPTPTSIQLPSSTSSSSSSSSSSLPLIHFIKKYTNLPFSTYPTTTATTMVPPPPPLPPPIGGGDPHATTGTGTGTTSTPPKNAATVRRTVLQVSIADLYDILGMIRSLQYDLQLYNESIQQQSLLGSPLQVGGGPSSSSSFSSSFSSPTETERHNRIRYQQYRFIQQMQQSCPRTTRHSTTTTTTTTTTWAIPGLSELLQFLEDSYWPDNEHPRNHAGGPPEPLYEVCFDHHHHSSHYYHPPPPHGDTTTTLMDYCRPGTILIDTGIITGSVGGNGRATTGGMAVRCRSNRYRRTKTISGRITSVHEVSVEYVVALGRPPVSSSSSSSSSTYPTYAIVETTWVQSEFEHTRNVQYDPNNPYGMLLLPSSSSSSSSSRVLDELQQRGRRYQTYCSNHHPDESSSSSSSSSTGVFVQYQPGTFYPCHGTVRSTSSSSSSSSTHQPSRVGGRMIIDLYQSYIRGIHVCKPPADGIGADSILPTFQSYARYLRTLASSTTPPTTVTTNDNNNTTAETTSGPEDLLVLYGTKILEELIHMTWPVVCGFSLVTRNWGIVTVDGLSPISFQETIFDQALVLSATRKRLLRAIVTCHGQNRDNGPVTTTTTPLSNPNAKPTASADALPGKGEGLIILLYGPPGVGKTLTAEAIAELLRRPLYRVSMGELGTTPEHLEERLQNIFDLCIPWQALVLIDEAELLLQARTSNEILRNAMVCVMLRLLEYYPGILFLTTNNGIDQLDPAIASRITVALEYKALDLTSRKEIWRSCISRVVNGTTAVVDGEDTSLSDIRSEENIITLATDYDQLNGRQIKNAVQLASIVCQYEQLPLTLRSIQDVLEMTVSTST